MLQGTGVSSGVGYAQVLVWDAPKPNSQTVRKCQNPRSEAARFTKALASLTQKNEAVRSKTARRFGDTEAAIFDAYHLMLNDEESLVKPVISSIETQHFTAEYAVSTQFNRLAQQFLELESDYMRQRAEDIYALRDMLLQEMLGQPANNATHMSHPTIVVAHSLNPTDLANMDLSRLEGIVCESGGFSSHTAIVCRTLGIPAVLGAAGITEKAHNGDIIALDGDTGQVWLNPSREDVVYLRRRSREVTEKAVRAQLYRGLPTITLDGYRVELAANISRLTDVDTAMEGDAEAIGMFRTEIMHTTRLPQASEEDQFMVYRALLEKMAGKAVTVRTFDDGGHAPTLPIKGNAEEANPVIGYRGIRMCLGRRGFFKTQLRALLRASAYGTLKIMLPMVSTPEELDETLELLADVRLELALESLPYDEDTPIGLLLQLPAAALSANRFADKVDFFTIAMNDLIQFTLGVDRSNPQLGYLHHAYHPVLLQLVHSVTQAAHNAGKPCYLSGEVAQPEELVPLFLGLGADGLMLGPNFILPARRILNRCSYAECERLAKEVITLRTAEEVRQHVAAFNSIYIQDPPTPQLACTQ